MVCFVNYSSVYRGGHVYLVQEEGYKNEKLSKVIGFIIKNERKMASFTQIRLAKEAMISTNYVRDIEKGKKAVSVDILYRLCTTLGIGISDFFKQVEELMSEEKILFLE